MLSYRGKGHLGVLVYLRGTTALSKERAEQMVLHQGEPAEAFEWFKVDTAVGNVRNKGPELIQPM